MSRPNLRLVEVQKDFWPPEKFALLWEAYVFSTVKRAAIKKSIRILVEAEFSPRERRDDLKNSQRECRKARNALRAHLGVMREQKQGA